MGESKKNWVYLGMFFLASVLNADIPPTASVNIQRSFVPVGFDDNDRAQVVVTGEFSSTCYKVAPATFEVRDGFIDIEQHAYVYGGICLYIMVPYSQVVDLGILPEGDYQLRDKTSGKILGSLPIARAKSASADEFLYAPVEQAYVRVEPGKNTVVLSGFFLDPCTKIKDVIVTYSKTNDVIMVQPIAVHDSKSPQGCAPRRNPYTHLVPISDGLRCTQLLHVRTLDGQSLNRLTSFSDVCPK